MKNTLLKLKSCIKFIGASIFLLALNANAGIIYLEESTIVGNEITINLKGAEFNDGLATGSFFASWDASKLTYLNINFNESLYDFVNYVGYVDLASGFLDDGIFSAQTGVDSVITSGEFLIATLTFEILAKGISQLDVAQGWDIFGPQPYYDPTFTEITDVTYKGTSVDTNVSVPEPSTLAIFALAMLGLASRKFSYKA